MIGLTKRQFDMLEAIRAREGGGVAPSVEELRQDLGLASKASVVRLLRGLRDRGLVSWLPNRARTLHLTDIWANGLSAIPDAALLAKVQRRAIDRLEKRSTADLEALNARIDSILIGRGQ